jgi:chromosome segregation ATPase
MSAREEYAEAKAELEALEHDLAQAILDEAPSKQQLEAAEEVANRAQKEYWAAEHEHREYAGVVTHLKGKVTKARKRADKLAHLALEEG